MRRIKTFQINVKHKRTILVLLGDTLTLFFNKGLPWLSGFLMTLWYYTDLKNNLPFYVEYLLILFLFVSIAFELKFEYTEKTPFETETESEHKPTVV